MKALLLDIGNTRIKWGTYDGSRLGRTGFVTHDHLKEVGMSALTSKLPVRVDTVFASNVAGTSFGTRISGVLGAHCNAEVHFAHTTRRACGLTNGYRQPRQMGVDRWVAMIGAWSELEASSVVVDAGTAVTIDAIDDDGQHLGGQILPGAHLMNASLSRDTSDIDTASNNVGKAAAGTDMFGKSTARAVQQGAWNAIVGAVERSLHMLEEQGAAPALILTGGDASRILKALGNQAMLRPHLVLQGLARLLDEDQRTAQ